MFQIHLLNGLGGAERLENVELRRLPGVHVAERTSPGAFVTEDHQRGRSHAPALIDVGAVCLLTHGVEFEASHQLLHLEVVGIEAGCDLHPIGARRLSGQPAVDQDRLFRPLLGAERSCVEKTVNFKSLVSPLTPAERRQLSLGLAVAEHGFEVRHELIDGLLQRDLSAYQIGQVRHLSIGDPTWVHHLEVIHVRVEIEGEAVHCHPAGDPDPNGGNLALFDPNPGQTILSPTPNVEFGQGPDQNFFETPDVRHYLLWIVEGKNRIPDELAGAVESDIAAPVDVVDLCRQLGPIDQQVRGVAVSSDGENGRVLEQQQVVVRRAPNHLALMDRTLEIPGLRVGQAPQPAGPQHRLQASSCSQSQVSRFSLILLKKRTAVDPSRAR